MAAYLTGWTVMIISGASPAQHCADSLLGQPGGVGKFGSVATMVILAAHSASIFPEAPAEIIPYLTTISHELGSICVPTLQFCLLSW